MSVTDSDGLERFVTTELPVFRRPPLSRAPANVPNVELSRKKHCGPSFDFLPHAS
jgi:hypothetical protein